MRPPEIYISEDGFHVPYEDLWNFLQTSWRSLKGKRLRYVGRGYILIVQTFVLGGRRFSRRALLSFIRKGDYRIFPHENTFPEGVEFYRMLSREVDFQFAPVMLIGEDREGVLKGARILEKLAEVSHYGVETVFYTADVKGELPKEMVIADGHHRFEGYGDEIFSAFIDVRDPALVILPPQADQHAQVQDEKGDIGKGEGGEGYNIPDGCGF